jgi:MFS family permease
VTDIGRPEPPERGLLARIAVDIRPLRESRDFRRLWFGVGISAIGSQITTVAIPFQLYEQTRSTLLVGLLGLAALVPLLVVPLYGGAVADAVDRRRMLLLSDVAQLVVTGGLLVNALLPNPTVWALFAGEVFGTTAYGFQRPARNALTPRLVREDQLLAAIAVEDVVFTLARVAGPVMAGVLISVVGLAGAYAIDMAPSPPRSPRSGCFHPFRQRLTPTGLVSSRFSTVSARCDAGKSSSASSSWTRTQ